ncbi:MAG: translocation/assembly module TamB domain-containing protein [Phormidesmis sp.]
MSNPPAPSPPDQTPEPLPDQPPNPPRRRYATLLKVGAGVGTVVALVGTAGWLWGDRLINQYIIPRVEDEIAKSIDRPIDLGEVERLYFWGVRLGQTVLPATDTDESTVTADAVEFSVDARSLLFQRTLRPDVIVIRPNLVLNQAEDGQWLDFVFPEAGEEDPLITLEVQTIEVQDAHVTVSTFNQAAEAAVPRQAIEITKTDGLLSFYGEEAEQVSLKLNGEVESGRFNIRGEGNLAKKAIRATVRSQDLPIIGANLFLPASVGLSAGTLNSNLTVQAALTEDNKIDPSVTDLRGTVRLQDGEALVSELFEPVSDVNSLLRFRGQRVTLEDTELRVGEVAAIASGDADLQEGYNLTAQIPAVTLAEVQTLAKVDLPVAVSGAFQLTTLVTGDIETPRVQGRLENLQPVQVDKLGFDTVAANFAMSLPQFEPTLLDLTSLRLVPQSGGTITASGQADLTDLEDPTFQLTAQADLPADAFAQTYGVSLPEGIVVGALAADIEAEGDLRSQTAFAQWQLSDSSFPGQGELTLVDNTLFLDNTRLRVAEGTVTAEAVVELENGDWQATASTEQVPIEQFTTQAQGLLTADIEAFGNLNALALEDIEARGTAAIADAQIRLAGASESLIERGTWRTAFEWEGAGGASPGENRIAVDSFTAPGVYADGTIGVDFAKPIPIGELALYVSLDSFDLEPLNQFAPQRVREYGQLTGFTSFDGQLTGTVENPQVAGDARLNNLAFNQLLFEPLAGPVDFSLANGGSVDLRGREDRLQVAVNEQAWPTSFEVRNQEFVARGYGEGRQLHADIIQLPLSTLNLRPTDEFGLRTATGAPFGPISGLLSASIDANLRDFSSPIASGTLTVDQPSLDPIDAEQIVADFRYADGTATLEQGELLFDDSRYLLTGSASLAPDVQYEGELTIAEGKIEDLVEVIENIDLSSFNIGEPPLVLGSASDLVPTDPARLPAVSFLQRLDSFVAFVESQPEDTADPGTLVIPPLEDLEGEFTGVVKLAGSSLALGDLTADFDIRGNSWEWGTYSPANRFVLSGDVQQNTFSVESAFISAGDTTVDLSGSGSLNQLEGQLNIDNLPVELVGALYPLPVNVAGELDVNTTFGGSLANPVVQGEALIADAQVSEYPLSRAGANFSYRDAKLAVEGEAALAPDDEPITVAGNLLYAFPFMTIQPPAERIAATAIVPGDSFDFINTLTDNQVRWEGGTGEIVVQVDGTLAEPEVVGQASFDQGVVSSSYLSDNVTNINGEIQFDLEQVGIRQLQANMGDGQVSVVGRLPLLASGRSILATKSQPVLLSQAKQSPPNANGLLISLDALPVDYDGILEAVFGGQVLVAGAVLQPTISGNVKIDDGQVQANELLSKAGSLSLPTREELEEISPYRVDYLNLDPLAVRQAEKPKGFLGNVSLRNLELAFGDRLNIVGQPFYNINALGSLTVSGTLDNLQPIGTIELDSGWINLFSTQFRLDPNAPNTATFTPETGLNPFVDVVMTARVQDRDIVPVPPSNGGFLNAETEVESGLQTIGEVRYIKVQAIANGPASELTDSLTLTSNSSLNQGELLALLGSGVFTDLTTASYTQLAGFLGAGNLANFGDRIARTLNLTSFSVFPTTTTSPESSVDIGIGLEATASLNNRIDISALQILNGGTPPQLGVQYRMTDDFQVRGLSNLDNTEFRLEYRTNF